MIERAIPDYAIVFSNSRKSDTCVVIPVINEGERIIALLTRMQILGIAAIYDTIIVDGGSSDGSLENDRLNNLGVRALLIKRGAGKLSAQLRCGYGYALDEGYKGIITIDGNNKDDPEAIPRFAQALADGFDFIQASRYVLGGVAINTPKVRDFAIRILHAPLLSLSSGFHWTDTTQGFRAYSRRLLEDPRVNIFRDIFVTYELLAYLSYRAPKLGYRCIELPTRREYPDDGSVPTKISSLSGNWGVFKILINACMGKYDPREQK